MVVIMMSMAMQRFRAAKSLGEEKCLLGEATPRNTAYNIKLKWAGKAFETWNMSRSKQDSVTRE